MKKEHSLLHISSQENICVGELFRISVEFNFAHATQITSLSGIFEGKFRTKISNQVEFRQIVAFRIEFDALIRQWRARNGKIYAPAGHHKAETRIVIGKNCPGSYSGKYGSIEYLTAVKLSITDYIGHSELVRVRPVKVIALVDINRYVSFHVPVQIERYFHKRLFCFNKSSVKVLIGLSKAAFVRGEKIAISGEIDNKHPKNPVKSGIVRLVMVARFRCKGNEKFSQITLSYFALPIVPQCSVIEFEHSLQVPNDAFPTYSHPDALINSSYHITVMINDCPPIEIPLVIGSGMPAVSVPSQNNQPSLLAVAGHAKIRPFSSTLQRQTFLQPLSQSQVLALAKHHPPQFLTRPPVPPPLHLYSYFSENELHFLPLGRQFPFRNSYHPQEILPQERFPRTRYRGQSVLRIEEIK